MALRQWDPDILMQDWFVNLADVDQKLFLYSRSLASQAGIWRPIKMVTFSRLYNKGKQINKINFVERINKDEAGKPIIRIKILDNGNWFFPEYFIMQLGKVFRPKIGAHRGALKTLLENGIKLTDIADFDWQGLEHADYKIVKDLAHGKVGTSSIDRLSEHDVIAMWTRQSNDEIEPYKQETKNNDTTGDESDEKKIALFFGAKTCQTGHRTTKPVYTPVSELYQYDFKKLLKVPSHYKSLTEDGFESWKAFVRFTVNNQLTDLLVPQYFLSPADIQTLQAKDGFEPDNWPAVIGKLRTKKLVPADILFFDLRRVLEGKPPGRSRKDRGGGDVSGQNYDDMTI